MECKDRVKLSWFSGIAIEMCMAEDDTPHFHAVADYEELRAVFSLEGSLLYGSLPSWGLEDVPEWAFRHAAELREAWSKCRHGETPSSINSLDDDDEFEETGERLPVPVEVEARPGFKIWVRFDDGVSGEIDLSHLAGKGVFKAWNDPEFFKGVYVDPGRAIAWSEEIDICPDAVYMEVKGLTVEEMFPDYFKTPADA